jgi:hypothetical protein
MASEVDEHQQRRFEEQSLQATRLELTLSSPTPSRTTCWTSIAHEQGYLPSLRVRRAAVALHSERDSRLRSTPVRLRAR